jgi:hypothetical protein
MAKKAKPTHNQKNQYWKDLHFGLERFTRAVMTAIAPAQKIPIEWATLSEALRLRYGRRWR